MNYELAQSSHSPKLNAHMAYVRTCMHLEWRPSVPFVDVRAHDISMCIIAVDTYRSTQLISSSALLAHAAALIQQVQWCWPERAIMCLLHTCLIIDFPPHKTVQGCLQPRFLVWHCTGGSSVPGS